MALSKRTTFTDITPLPPNVDRALVIEFLQDHQNMIDLNPLVVDRYRIPPPPHAAPDEQKCAWYQIHDRISYIPGTTIADGAITYTAAFHDLPNGLQTHSFAAMGTEIREKWTIGGSLPGEPPEPPELGLNLPREGLYLRDDVDFRCNVFMASFVKKTLRKAHGTVLRQIAERASRQGSAPAPALYTSLPYENGYSAYDSNSNTYGQKYTEEDNNDNDDLDSISPADSHSMRNFGAGGGHVQQHRHSGMYVSTGANQDQLRDHAQPYQVPRIPMPQFNTRPLPQFQGSPVSPIDDYPSSSLGETPYQVPRFSSYQSQDQQRQQRHQYQQDEFDAVPPLAQQKKKRSSWKAPRKETPHPTADRSHQASSSLDMNTYPLRGHLDLDPQPAYARS